MKKLGFLRKHLVFGAAGGLLLVMGMLLGTGLHTTANDNINPAVVSADNGGFGKKVAGTYYTVYAESSAIVLQLSEEGGMTARFGNMFSNGFGDHPGTWQKTGKREVQATSLNIQYATANNNEFEGLAITTWQLEFDKNFQTVTGVIDGATFGPGVDPLNPGDAEPIATFGGNPFVLQRLGGDDANND